MILDRWDRLAVYGALHERFSRAVRFAEGTDLLSLSEGRHEIDGDDVFVLVAASAGRGRQGSPLEAHRRYIDIQYVLAGEDVIGYSPLEACRSSRDPYDAARDIEFFNDPPHTWLPLPAGTFAIFLPTDAHAPLAGEGMVRKVVIKVRV
ncbi:MAG: YhcH/YjgK/YiaL family protein [Phycisphaerae bacterium]|nr:YhcH/YjgK/YiaL family protein [Phycisphaerae bacterium]